MCVACLFISPSLIDDDSPPLARPLTLIRRKDIATVHARLAGVKKGGRSEIVLLGGEGERVSPQLRPRRRPSASICLRRAIEKQAPPRASLSLSPQIRFYGRNKREGEWLHEGRTRRRKKKLELKARGAARLTAASGAFSSLFSALSRSPSTLLLSVFVLSWPSPVLLSE